MIWAKRLGGDYGRKSRISILAHFFPGNHRLDDGNDFITASFFIDFSFVLAYYATMEFP